MTLRAATATVTLLLSTILAAQQQFTDPANLRGERVRPRDGRELPIDQGARGLEQMLRRLNTRASLMLIVAHPDDEDGGMLTYYSRGLGARVAVLTLTRGEGGQNAMTGDFEDALGLLRTQELLSADRYLGVDQFFGTEVDFGFSKTKEEAFKKWTHERVLYDAVRSIRLYRPLVIAAVFIGGVTDGHGQHQVSGQIAQEAFKAAADPTVFPDMIAEGILPWQPLKVYARVPMQSISDKGLFDYATGKYTAPRFENYVTGEITTTVPSSDVIVHEGTPDKLLSDNPSDPPRTYVQFARIGLGLQKSQVGRGMRVPPSGAFDVAYHRYGSKLAKQPEHETSFFDGIDISLGGIADLAPYPPSFLRLSLATIMTDIRQAGDDFDLMRPQLIAPKLADALKRLDILREEWKKVGPPRLDYESVKHELLIKHVQLNDALVLSLGLNLDATSETGDASEHSDVAVHTVLTTTSADTVHFFSEELRTTPGNKTQRGPLSDGDPVVSTTRPWVEDLKANAAITGTSTRPYFFRHSIEEPLYQLRDRALRNAATSPYAMTACANLTYGKVDIEVERLVHNGSQPLQLAANGSLSLSTHSHVLPNSLHSTVVSTFLYPIEHPAIEPTLALPVGWKSHIAVSDVISPGEMGIVVEVPASGRKAEVLHASATLQDGSKITEGYRPIGYGDLPRTNYYTPATVRIVPVDLNLPQARIAYLPGTGDAVPEALASINLKPEILTVADLTPAKLSHYDTIILGVRTYAAHPELHGAPTQALLDYVRNGGNVLVQYQTAEFTAADAPYPLTLGYSAEKVVDETDPVQLIDPTAAFLTTPNKITPADFNNWVEERGHGFLSEWDAHYIALTETHDPDQDPQRGGLITTNLGKGRWTYCAFALYRQLPEAVPGAFRLFVNLLTPATSR